MWVGLTLGGELIVGGIATTKPGNATNYIHPTTTGTLNKMKQQSKITGNINLFYILLTIIYSLLSLRKRNIKITHTGDTESLSVRGK